MKAAIRSVLAVCLLASLAGSSQAQPDYKKWYLAEGSTGFFEEEILIGNPNTVDATVTVTYLVPSGVAAPQPTVVTVKAFGRGTVTAPAGYPAISAVVTSTQPVVVERSMYWGGTQRLGGHNSAGVTSPAVEWYLAEGATGFFDTYILVANPTSKDTTVEVTFYGPASATEVRTFAVAANTRINVNARVNAGITFPAFSARIRSLDPTAPIIVERAMYWGNGGTNETALTRLSPVWRFGEGYTASGFETYVLVANPNDQAAAITTTFYFEDGSTTEDTREVPARSRENIHVNSQVPNARNKSFSILVRCTNSLPIAAERAMYNNGFREGHAVAGNIEEANAWAFAEGLEDRFNGIDYDTYFLLNNAGDSLVTVTATFLLEDGTGFQRTFDIGGRSRKTLPTGLYLELSNKRFATFFQASGPIVAERSVYWGQGYYGGHASAGTQWSLAIPAPTTAPAGPTVASITPAYGSTNGGTDVVITGTNFRQDATVTIGGAGVASVRVDNAQTIVVRTPGSTAGAKAVAVRSLGQTATNQPAFTYEAPVVVPPLPPVSSTAAQGQPAAVYCTAFASNGVCTRVQTHPFPQNYYGLMIQLANQRPDLLRASCRETGGNNEFMFEAVRRLRAETGSNRWGLNWKRGNIGDLSQDIVTYFYGPEGTEMANDVRVYLFDIIGGHCGNNPVPFWIDVSDDTRRAGTIGRWTTAGRSF
jgi:hypothetical protein